VKAEIGQRRRESPQERGRENVGGTKLERMKVMDAAAEKNRPNTNKNNSPRGPQPDEGISCHVFTTTGLLLL
jgi:hypothetical protein